MRALIVIVQLLLSLVVVALSLPLVLLNVPRAQDPVLGPLAGFAIGAVIFVGIRVLWPARRS